MCTIPAIFFALSVSIYQYVLISIHHFKAKEAEARGDIQGANSKGRTALVLNIVATVGWIVVAAIFVITPIAIVASSSYRSSYIYYYYYY